MFKYRGNKEVCRYQGWIPETIEDVNDFIGRKQNPFGTIDTWFQLAIVFKESNKMIGDIGLHFLPKKTCEFGITLHPDHHGQGLAKEVLNTTMNYLKKEEQIQQFKATIDSRNTNSIKLFESIGFALEKELEAEEFRGEIVSCVVYSLSLECE